MAEIYKCCGKSTMGMHNIHCEYDWKYKLNKEIFEGWETKEINVHDMENFIEDILNQK